MNFRTLDAFNKLMVWALTLATLLAMVAGWQLLKKEQQQSQQQRQQQFASLVRQWDSRFASTADYLSQTQTLAQQWYKVALQHQHDFSFNQDLQGYRWRNLQTGTVLFGLGDAEQKTHLQAQWQMALQLADSFRLSASLLPDVKWFYYQSLASFSAIYPQTEWPVQLFDSVSPRLQQGSFINNPNRLPYHLAARVDDFSNSGNWLLGMAVPVDYLGQQLGIIVVDLDLLAIQARFEQQAVAFPGQFYLVDQHGLVVASNQPHDRAQPRLPAFVEQLPERLRLVDFAAMSMSQGEQIGDYQVYASRLPATAWQMVYIEPIAPLAQFMPKSSGSWLMVALLALLALLVLMQFFTRRQFVLPAMALVRHIDVSSQEQVGRMELAVDVHALPTVPSWWLPWFDSVTKAFAQNHALLASLREHNDKLDRAIIAKTQELQTSHVRKERSLALVRALLDSIPDLIYFKNIDGSYLGCNRAYIEFLGLYREEDIVGAFADQFYNELEVLEINRVEQQVLSNTEPVFFVKERVLKNGKKVVQEHNIKPFYNSQQQLLGIMGVVRDITAQTQLFAEVEQSERTLRNAIEFAANGILMFSPQFMLLQSNRAASKILGDGGCTPLKPITDIFPEHGERISKLLQGLQLGHENLYWPQLKLASRGVDISLSASAVFDNAGLATLYMLHIHDISEQVHAAEELNSAKHEAERANLAKGRFLANISHEIRTPLNAVIGLVGMTLDTAVTRQQREFLQKAEHSARTLLRMINDILDFSRAEAGKLVLHDEPFNVNDVIADTFAIVVQQAYEKQLVLDCDVAIDLPVQLRGDSLRLGQVLINLLSNAIKFTTHGQVTLQVQWQAQSELRGQLVVTVVDTGIGIESDKQQQLFEAFTQADDSMTRQVGGSGLGLAICKQFVELMGGEIGLTSTLGVGTEVQFTVPLAVESAARSVANWPMPTVQILMTDSALAARCLHKLAALQCPVSAQFSDWSQWLTSSPDNDDLLLIDQHSAEWLFTNQPAIALLKQRKQPIQVLASAVQSMPVPVTGLLQYQAMAEPFSAISLAHSWQVKEHWAERSAAVSPQVPALQGRSVLIVEDNAVNQQVLTYMLRDAGASPIIANNGEEALQMLTMSRVDMVLMDIQMPVMDGYEATRLIRQKVDAQYLPIVAMTAHSSPQDKARSFACGMNDHLTKPIVREEVYAAMQRIWEQIDAGVLAPVWDYEFCVSQFAGNEQTAQHLAASLVKQFSHLQQFPKDFEPVALTRQFHTLKGSAGNLGLFDLQAHARLLEFVLRQQLTPEFWQINKFQQAYQRAELAVLGAAVQGQPC